MDDEYWHMTDYYKNIRDKLTNIDANVGYCHKMSEVLPARVCNTPLQVRGTRMQTDALSEETVLRYYNGYMN